LLTKIEVILEHTEILLLIVGRDLHDNAFYGEILNLSSFKYFQNVNLGGNQFTGFFPSLPHSSSDDYLQMLNLGRNDLEGEIPDGAYENMTQLLEL
jgi:hypothetical protein